MYILKTMFFCFLRESLHGSKNKQKKKLSKTYLFVRVVGGALAKLAVFGHGFQPTVAANGIESQQFHHPPSVFPVKQSKKSLRGLQEKFHLHKEPWLCFVKTGLLFDTKS